MAIDKFKSLDSKFKDKLNKFLQDVYSNIQKIKQKNTLINQIEFIVEMCQGNEKMKSYFCEQITRHKIEELQDLIRTINTPSDVIEQETKKDAVNILTMHQAKGLTFDVCFIIAAEDHIIPGKNTGVLNLCDERRLLYVSLTRAKHKLYITFCIERKGQQSFLGREESNIRLTRFLEDVKIPIHNASQHN